MEQFVFVENHFLASFADDIVERGQFDRIDRAGLFAHATENTSEHIDLELGGVFFAVIPRRLGCLDMDAVGWANGGAHHARDTFDSSGGIAVETMHASEV